MPELPGEQQREGAAAVSAPVHARVLPSFLVEQLKRPFSTWMGPVEPAELVRWTRPSMPPGMVVADIQEDALRRLRQRHPELWARPVGIKLGSSWRSHLRPADVAGIERVIESIPGRDFSELSFLELKSGLRKPFLEVIALLAVLEAIDWVPPAGAPQRRPGWAAWRRFENGHRVELSEAIRERAERALALPWVDGIKPGDVRLPAPGGTAPAEWMREQLRGARVSSHLEVVANAILDVEEMSYAGEVRSLAEAALARCEPSPSADNAERWVGMFCGRYAAPELRTLNELGGEFGVTRERVRQICEAILGALRAGAVTPAVDRVLRMAARVVPCSIEDAEEQLVRQLGDGAGIRGAMELAAELGHEVPVRIGRVKVRIHGKYEDAPLLESAASEERWPQLCLRYAAAECVTLGCTSVIRVAGALALRDGVAPGQDAIEGVVTQAPGFRWLDEDNRWFSVGDTNGCGAATRLRKMLAVAHDSVGVDDVAAAFACDTRWFRDGDGRALAVPPTHVVQAMAQAWPWVKTVQYTRFLAAEPIPLKETLSDVEACVLKLIEDNDGVAAAWQLYKGVMELLPVTKMAVAVTLATSPILDRLEFGLYVARGRRIRPKSVARARLVLAQRQSAATPVPGDDCFRVRVTKASLRNEQYAVPARFKDRLAGRVLEIAGYSGLQARVTRSGALKGLNQCFNGLVDGDELEVRIEGAGITVGRVVDDAST